MRRGRRYMPRVVVLLAGGDKRTQDGDIELALGLAREL